MMQTEIVPAIAKAEMGELREHPERFELRAYDIFQKLWLIRDCSNIPPHILSTLSHFDARYIIHRKTEKE